MAAIQPKITIGLEGALQKMQVQMAMGCWAALGNTYTDSVWIRRRPTFRIIA